MIANCALAALWGFSALGGWGEEAFCVQGGRHDARCADGFADAVLVSLGAGVPAAALVVIAWALPRVRRNVDRLDGTLTLAALLWVLAEGIVFVGGAAVQP